MSTEEIAALTGLAAVLISPLVAYYTIKSQTRASRELLHQQLHADVVLNSRREWLSDLRNSLAEFVSTNLTVASYGAGPVQVDRSEHWARLAFLRSKILLLLNPHEKLHEELVAAMEAALKAIVEPSDDHMGALALATANNDVTFAAQRVLKREWEVIKRLESPPNTRMDATGVNDG